MATREQTYFPPDSNEQAFTRVLTRAYTLNWEAIAYAVILALALVTRFADLGTRVMSHDESLHTYYSWRLTEFGEFSHTPLMHGPLLFHMTALSYFLFGDTDFTSRIYPALLGVGIVMFPALFRRWLGRVGAVITSVLFLISPQLLYYSRYIRHDIPTIFFALIVLYAILRYLEDDRPRRAGWLWVLAGALLGMLASKEVAFIYIALFGSFMTLFWVMRLRQDIGVQRRPATDGGWHAPPLQMMLGHAILFGLAAVIAVPLGEFIRYAISASLWVPEGWWFDLPLFLALYLPLAGSGLVRSLAAGPGQSRNGAALALMRGLSNGKSAFMIIMAGLIIGVLVSLLIVCVLDIIKPDTIWTSRSVMSEYDQTYGPNASKEYAVSVVFDSAMFVRMITWIGVPVLILLFIVFLTAVFRFPGYLPLPWREILLVILVALMTVSVLVLFERRSYVEESTAQPFAADPTAAAQSDDGRYDNTPILIAWIAGTLATLAVLGTRHLTHWWDFFNRQPLFDVLIVIGTLILPWLAAFPLYWAGYNLEDYNPNTIAGRDTLEATLPAVAPFIILSVAVGISWNWKRWLPAAAVFIGLFGFFYTTVFSNQYGLVTGMIGSLGYWLEQQGVRRGSQPQYYYVLTQLPVYEFLPLIAASLAGIFSMSSLWGWRRQRAEAVRQARLAEARSQDEALAMDDDPAGDAHLAVAEPDIETLGEERLEGGESTDRRRLFGLPARLAAPFDLATERAHRALNPEWLGEFPFLALVGYWGVAILLGLTLAGEKMPWLTTHLTVPLILVSGWWLGKVATGIRWRAMTSADWLILLVAIPVAFMALGQVVTAVWGVNGPFRGREIEDLLASGNWLAALLILMGALYVVGRFGRRLGLAQLGRMAIVSGAVLLGVLTARAAYMASFINYDYATEFLVYAHAGPAIKTVLNEIDRIAEITNEGSNMRIVFDDESSWPYTWYFRHYPNYGFLRGEAGSVDPASLDGAKVVVVGSKKAGDVRRILGDRYYEFGYIRLWWPMQEYFNLTYDRVANVFSVDPNNIAARYYRQAMFDIWWDRDYSTYGQAMCIEGKQSRCEDEAAWGQTQSEQESYRTACERAVVAECRSDNRFAVNNWPVSDRMYFFVDKQIAAQVWDAGIGAATVNIREPEYPEDRVYRDIQSEKVIGQAVGMSGPRDIAIGADGLIYITDTDRNRIAVLDRDGTLVRTIGGVPQESGGAALLRQPWGIDVGPDGNVYVADTWNNRVAVFSPDGELLRAWGHEGIPSQDPSPDAFWGPRDVAIGPDGNVYVADTGGKRIRVYTPDGDFLRDIGTGGAAFGQLDEPVGLAFNPVSGDLYVAEAWNRRIQAFDLNGQPLREWPVNMWFRNRQSFNRPYIAFSPDGTLLYVTDMDDRHRIVAYNLEGAPMLSFNQPDNLEAGELGLRSPAGLAVDEAGRIYVVDAEQNKVFVFPPSEITGSVLPIPPQGSNALPDATQEATGAVTEPAAGGGG